MPRAAKTFRPNGVSASERTIERGKRYDQQRESSAKRGYGGRWQRTRAGFLKRHPLCVLSLTRGVVVVSAVVDHIAPHEGDNDLFWARWNWQALSKPSHDIDKQRVEAAWKAGRATIGDLFLGDDVDERRRFIEGYAKYLAAKS